MAAVAGGRPGRRGPGPATPASGRRRSCPVWRWAILVIVGAYFVIPLYAALRFTGFQLVSRRCSARQGFAPALELSVKLAVVTTVLTLVLMLPTTIYVHLRLPQAAPAAGGHHDPADRDPAGRAHRRRARGGAGLPEEHAVPARPRVRGAGHAVRLPVVRRRAARAGPAHAGRGGPVARRGLAADAVAGADAEPAHRAAVGHRAHRGPGARRVHHGQPGPVPDVPGVDRGLRPDQRPDLGRGLAAGAVRHLGLPDGDHADRRPVAPDRRDRSLRCSLSAGAAPGGS